MIEYLNPGKNLKIKTPFLDDKIVRYGTIQDGSCFFHAICTSCCPNYRQLTNALDKHKYVKKIRKDIADTLTINVWKSLYQSISVVNISKWFYAYINTYYNSITFTENIFTKTQQTFIDAINIKINKKDCVKIFEIISKKEIQTDIENSYNLFEQLIRNKKTPTFFHILSNTLQTSFQKKNDFY